MRIIYDWPETDDSAYAGQFCGVTVLDDAGVLVARIEGSDARAIGKRLEHGEAVRKA